MTVEYFTDLDELVGCVASAAEAIGVSPPSREETARFLIRLVNTDQREGGKDVMGCLESGLITEVEARDLVMAHSATWISHQSGVNEPSCESWSTPELVRSFEIALLGRPARGR